MAETNETTLIYHHAAEGWALLGAADGHLILRSVTPAELAAIPTREPVIVEDGESLPPSRDARGELVYPVAHLRPYLAYGVVVLVAFDGARWYRGREVTAAEREPYAV